LTGSDPVFPIGEPVDAVKVPVIPKDGAREVPWAFVDLERPRSGRRPHS
jgi:hypothetical protein